jgi:hypothetical protein
MPRRHTTLRLCPDCGGILQPTDPEALTTVEVAESEALQLDGPRQCLLCGYTETIVDEVSPQAR